MRKERRRRCRPEGGRGVDKIATLRLDSRAAASRLAEAQEQSGDTKGAAATRQLLQRLPQRTNDLELGTDYMIFRLE
jgi:hypothetical protein